SRSAGEPLELRSLARVAEHHVMAGAGEQRAELPPHEPRAQDADAHALSDLSEEIEDALPDQSRGLLVVIGRALVREQMAVPWIEEELRLGDRLRDLPGHVHVAPIVVLHGVDLERNARRPCAPVVLERDAAVEKERAACAWAILGELLCRHGP